MILLSYTYHLFVLPIPRSNQGDITKTIKKKLKKNAENLTKALLLEPERGHCSFRKI